MEIEMDSTPTIKKPEWLKQKTQARIGQDGKVHVNTEVNGERLGGTFKLPSAKFDMELMRFCWVWVYFVFLYLTPLVFSYRILIC